MTIDNILDLSTFVGVYGNQHVLMTEDMALQWQECKFEGCEKWIPNLNDSSSIGTYMLCYCWKYHHMAWV